jgi:sugar phosphate isomerase/epimerase
MNNTSLPRLSCADFAFPLLGHDEALQLIRMLGVRGVDIGVFSDRSHLRPESIREDPITAGRHLRQKLAALDLELADVFVQLGAEPSHRSANDPDRSVRLANRESFKAMVDFAHEAGATHMTGLPGVIHVGQSADDGLQLAAEESLWRMEAASKADLTYAIEPHVGSNCPTPEATFALLKRASNLTLTYDPGHFVYQGQPSGSANVLIAHASHFHARCGARGRLQARFSINQIADPRRPWICLEYVWVDWEGCNEVDNVSETILLKRHLDSLAATSVAHGLTNQRENVS